MLMERLPPSQVQHGRKRVRRMVARKGGWVRACGGQQRASHAVLPFRVIHTQRVVVQSCHVDVR